ncbi:Crp/Fnr family transcriptional regulator [Tenacibaculum haliotis]|uniref:Crp/Fnr family transcriptional regulator n=1 Tax=Tenacibaculum haliotis TaxID=1888914 RepID=UPI0021B08110|nr:Crp/Fnr family transcriptional regulator [Tenacibaculum haliotis]MCT4698195.1 Crp/Fnr family transcriptional regulator [Tenacibaculum haliotis]
MDFFKNFVTNFYDLSESSYNTFHNIVTSESLPKKHQIVKLSQIPVNFYILKKGVIRAYIIDEKGKEHTKTLFTPVVTSGNLGALIKREPSNLIYECLTDCEVLRCNYNSFYNLSKLNHDISIFHHKVLEAVYIKEEIKIFNLLMLDAKQRYEELKNRLPGIGKLINQYHIASYLNITPVQLSRIRKSYHN